MSKTTIKVNLKKGSEALIEVKFIEETGICNETSQTYLKLIKQENKNEKLYLTESLEELEKKIFDAKN
ncbi:hypothetical protein NYQ10_16260 [Flavobacterium johnsoniae]|uniref:hypothetical protein n=1 Tax=Flavobacterium johnsoniae TaxID=986 RepID=UPI0025B140C6|nr:hypothetical protein [Flavobacterium johnsoniae]WJS93646.1 hypothetical protein NYQ10_16260 [Flavobacterium johnsoniae]